MSSGHFGPSNCSTRREKRRRSHPAAVRRPKRILFRVSSSLAYCAGWGISRWCFGASASSFSTTPVASVELFSEHHGGPDVDRRAGNRKRKSCGKSEDHVPRLCRETDLPQSHQIGRAYHEVQAISGPWRDESAHLGVCSDPTPSAQPPPLRQADFLAGATQAGPALMPGPNIDARAPSCHRQIARPLPSLSRLAFRRRDARQHPIH